MHFLKNLRVVSVLSLEKHLVKKNQRGINLENNSGELLLIARHTNKLK